MTTSPLPQLPMRLGRYVLLEQLGQGGMGEVYRALRTSSFSGIERLCVVKTVQARHLGNAAIVRRFLDEARTSLALSHPNLCTTYDLDDEDGVVLLSMEHIEGRDLWSVFQAAVAADAPLSVDEVVALGCDLLAGLHHAHEAKDPRTGASLGLVHRDISPHNVMVAFDGTVKVIDFGIARSSLQTSHTESGAVLGKLHYMPPEQLGVVTGAFDSKRPMDRRVDVFAAAVVLCELASGLRYYRDRAEALAVLEEDGQGAFVSPALAAAPPALVPVLSAALSRDLRRRVPTAAAFAELLRAEAPAAAASSTVVLRGLLARLFLGAAADAAARTQALFRRAARFAGGSGSGATVDAFAATVVTKTPVLPPTAGDTDGGPAESTAEGFGDDEVPTLDARPAVASTIVEVTKSAASPVAPPIALSPAPAPRPLLRSAALAGLALLTLAAVVVAGVRGSAWADEPEGESAPLAVPLSPAPSTLPAPLVAPTPMAATAPSDDTDDEAGDDTGDDLAADAGVDGRAAAAGAASDAKAAKPKRAPTPLPARPTRIGLRVAYLQEHCRRAPCAASTLRQAAALADADPAEIRAVHAAVARCLDACGAPP